MVSYYDTSMIDEWLCHKHSISTIFPVTHQDLQSATHRAVKRVKREHPELSIFFDDSIRNPLLKLLKKIFQTLNQSNRCELESIEANLFLRLRSEIGTAINRADLKYTLGNKRDISLWKSCIAILMKYIQKDILEKYSTSRGVLTGIYKLPTLHAYIQEYSRRASNEILFLLNLLLDEKNGQLAGPGSMLHALTRIYFFDNKIKSLFFCGHSLANDGSVVEYCGNGVDRNYSNIANSINSHLSCKLKVNSAYILRFQGKISNFKLQFAIKTYGQFIIFGVDYLLLGRDIANLNPDNSCSNIQLVAEKLLVDLIRLSGFSIEDENFIVINTDNISLPARLDTFC